MIGFDLDGVFVADMEFSGDIQDFLEARHRQKTLFVPKSKYVIITGRPSSDKTLTVQWVDRELSSNPPTSLFHDNTDLNEAAVYKASVIQSLGVDVFVESDSVQAEVIAGLVPQCRVITFREYIQNALYELR